MRSVLAALFLVATASLSPAGVLVELTDGTSLTVESHWIDGDQVHLVRGGVDMIVPKSRIKSMDENVDDPEVLHGSGEAIVREKADAGSEPSSEAAVVAPVASTEASLPEASADELEQVHQEESERLRALGEKRFNVGFDPAATPEERQAAEEAAARQQQRAAQAWAALQRARRAEGVALAVPQVEQPQ